MGVIADFKQRCVELDVWYKRLYPSPPHEVFLEALKVPYVEHRGIGHNWHSCSLFGAGLSHQTNTLAYHGVMNPTWTEIEHLCPHTKSWVESLPLGKLQRVRFMKLGAGGWIKAHKDSNVRNISSAINVALNYPDGCSFRRVDTGEEFPMEPLTSWFFDNGVEHELENNSDTDRYALIIHDVGWPEEKHALIY